MYNINIVIVDDFLAKIIKNSNHQTRKTASSSEEFVKGYRWLSLMKND